MNPSVISWISQQSPLELYSNIHRREITTAGVESSMMMNQCEFNGSFFGQDCLSPANVSTSGEMDMAAQLQHQTPPHHYTHHFSSLHDMGVLDFGYLNPPHHQQDNPMRLSPVEELVHPDSLDAEEAVPPRPKKKRIRPPSQTYDHIIAERRRREQLSQLFAALSALIPGLKKMDKSSILEDAIKYMKRLQERVGVLEENAEMKAMESVVVVRKSRIVIDDDDDDESAYERRSGAEEQALPEIEGRVCDKQILVKVHCEKQKDALANLICKVESLNMTVVSTNATPFGGVTLDITIVAEMEKEFNSTVKDVVIALREALHPPSSTEILNT